MAKNQFLCKLIGSVFALALAFFIIEAGISLIERVISAGNIKRSSKYPRTGMKSGIRSIGLKAYPSVKRITNFGRSGVIGSLYAK